MAKPEQYTAEQMITAIQAAKGLVSFAARKLGCTPDTVRAYVKRYASVRDALHEARYAMGDTAELSLFDQVAKGESWAVQFYLKTQCKNRGYVERLETSNQNQNWDMSTFSNDELMRIAEGVDPAQVVKDRKP